MDGIFIHGRRPKSKKEVKMAVENEPDTVRIECTSAFANDYDGVVGEAPDGSYAFVGPDPYRARNFYGTITVVGGRATVT